MFHNGSMQLVAENLWVLRYPLRILGADIGRVVTIIRLRSGELIIHSTGPFTSADVSAISHIGRPAWLVEATMFHDAYVSKGRNAFPSLPYLVPDGFREFVLSAEPLGSPPAAWRWEVDVLRLEGMPKVQEHVFFHRPSKTLIVADLIFNFGPNISPWTFKLMRYVSGLKSYPGMSRLFRMMIRDRDAFSRSLRLMMEWDFDRVIVAHGEIIETGGKQKLQEVLSRTGLIDKFS